MSPAVEAAVALAVRTKSQIQALDRTQPMLPVRPGLPASRTHDYVRHGTTTLFAAPEVATGKVTDACYPRHRHQEFLKFLRQVAKAYPRVPLHIVCDNYDTHKHDNVQRWLARHPRITLHFTPTSASWLNLVETFLRSSPARPSTVAATGVCAALPAANLAALIRTFATSATTVCEADDDARTKRRDPFARSG